MGRGRQVRPGRQVGRGRQVRPGRQVGPDGFVDCSSPFTANCPTSLSYLTFSHDHVLLSFSIFTTFFFYLLHLHIQGVLKSAARLESFANFQILYTAIKQNFTHQLRIMYTWCAKFYFNIHKTHEIRLINFNVTT